MLLTLFIMLPSAFGGNPSETWAAIDSALGGKIDLKDKVVYVDFWASWCPPCQRSFPWMEKLLAGHSKDGLQIVAINLDKDHSAAQKFLDKHKVDLPVIFDSTGNLAKLYSIEAMPTSILYGRDGKFRSRHEGFVVGETAETDSLIRQLLGERSE
jgi:thiol-disulfide isomerase/thioredoxin